MSTSSLARLNWYSFLIGTQVAATSGVLTSTTNYPYVGRIRPAREFLYPSLHSGSTIFLFRIKEPGNGVRFVLKLVQNVFEKFIVGGCVYVLLEKQFHFEDKMSHAFAFGGIMGMFFSCRYNLHTSCWETLLSSVISAEMTVFLEELREILVSEGILGIRDFELVVPFNSFSFWNGALVGCAVDGLYGQGLGNYLDDVEFPEIGVDDSGFETTLNILSFIGDLGSGCFKVVLHLHERAFVGGFLYCALEATLKYYTSTWGNSAVLLSPVCATLLGLYLGISSRNVKKVCEVSCAIICSLQLLNYLAPRSPL